MKRIVAATVMYLFTAAFCAHALAGPRTEGEALQLDIVINRGGVHRTVKSTIRRGQTFTVIKEGPKLFCAVGEDFILKLTCVYRGKTYLASGTFEGVKAILSGPGEAVFLSVRQRPLFAVSR